MDCSYFQQQICRSCSQLSVSYRQTLDQKRDALLQLFPETEIGEFSVEERATGSRIRARLAITGTVEQPQTGFFDDQQKVVPVDQCPLHHPLINEWIQTLPELIRSARLAPYDMSADRGELKFVVLTCSPTHRQLMVQFVLRSREAVDRIRSLWRRMSDADKQLVPVMSVNIQPTRSSAIAGREEVLISDQTFLPIQFGDRELVFGPQSFLQTNYEAAASLYRAAARIIGDSCGERLLDLYCGAGAFSLTAGSMVKSILGIDVSPDAILCANESVRRNVISNAEFQCRSLECTTADQLADREFDTIICNPPRRGLDAASVSLLQALKSPRIIYSSCNAATLHRDVQLLASEYRVEFLQPFDMFPFTHHFEVLALLRRVAV